MVPAVIRQLVARLGRAPSRMSIRGALVAGFTVLLAVWAFAGYELIRSLIDVERRVTAEHTTFANAGNTNRNMSFQLVALLRVEKDGKVLDNLTTEKRGYLQQQSPTTEVGIRSSFLEDLYVILSDVRDITRAVNNDPGAQTVTFTFIVNPLVGWIWFGGMIIALGGLVGLWPSAGAPARAPVPARSAPIPAGAGAD